MNNNRPVMKEKENYNDLYTLSNRINNIIDTENEEREKVYAEQQKAAVKLYNQSMDKAEKRANGKKVTYSDEEIAARLDGASMHESHLFRQSEALNAYQQEQKQWNKVHTEREKVLQHEYEKSL